jgi:hypothetical protein
LASFGETASAPALRSSLSLKLWPLMLTMIEWCTDRIEHATSTIAGLVLKQAVETAKRDVLKARNVANWLPAGPLSV